MTPNTLMPNYRQLDVSKSYAPTSIGLHETLWAQYFPPIFSPWGSSRHDPNKLRYSDKYITAYFIQVLCPRLCFTGPQKQTRKSCYDRRENCAMPAVVNFDTYRISQRHRTYGFPATARFSCWSLSADCSESSGKK